MELVGRHSEQEIFKHALNSTESKLIAVYGRRRVGKTYLVRKYFSDKIKFEVAGLHNGDLTDQLKHFTNTLEQCGWKGSYGQSADSWKSAFAMLEDFITQINTKGKQKKVIFLDELPWFDTPRSKFLMAFENFWNSFCTKRNDLLVIICGSSASWIIKKILKNKGALHNRVSEKIRINPFNLFETKTFLTHKVIKWSNYDITQLYMTTGGVPYYIDAVRKGESVIQFIDRACFTKNGVLIDEYELLFKSLFDNSDRHYKIVETLYNKKMGMTRNEIVKKSKLESGGTLTNTLNELVESGFISTQLPYLQKNNNTLYKLTDHFVLFFLKFMKNSKNKTNQWLHIVNSQSWTSWSGLAFERICYSHIPQIKKALNLEAIQSEISPWQKNNDTQGAQIDMLIDRADRIINICEIKFSMADFIITKDYAKKLRNKIQLFNTLPSTKKKTCFLTMITTYGTFKNEYSTELVQNEVTINDLFKPF